MKSLTFSSPTRQPLPGRFSSVKRTVAGTIAGLSFLFAPIAQRALAQPAPKGQTKPSIIVSGKPVQIENISANMFSSSGPEPAIVTVQGPLELSVNVYPILKAWKFANKESLVIDISYMLDGKKYLVKGKVDKLDEKAHGIEIKKGHTIGTVVEIRLAIPDGAHQVSLLDDAIIHVEENMPSVDLDGKTVYDEPIGVVSSDDTFLDIVPLVQPKPKKPEKKAAPPEKKPEKKIGAEEAPAPKPELIIKTEPAEKPKQAIPSRLIDLKGKRFNLVGLNTGDVNEIGLLATPLVSDMLAVAVGSNLSSHGRELVLDHFNQTMRTFSANLEAGLGFSKGKHNAFLVVFGGVRKTDGMLTLSDGRTDPLRLLEAEYGARAGYDYDGILGVTVHGSNNPFNPAKLELYASLPYWYLDENFPTLTADARLLNLLREKVVQDIVGKTSLDVADVQSRLTLSIPVARLGPIVPAVLGGLDLSTADGLKVSGHVGGALGADILDTVKLEAGAAYGFDGRLMIILNGRLLH